MKLSKPTLFMATLAFVAGVAVSSAKADVSYEYPRQHTFAAREVVATHPLKRMAAYEAAEEMKLSIVVNFANGKDTLTKEESAKVAKVAEMIKMHKPTHVMVNGYTDSVGKSVKNQDLSYRRALRVANLLVKHYGVMATVPVVKGMGAVAPVATNTTEAGRSANRRVEFVFVGGSCEQMRK